MSSGFFKHFYMLSLIILLFSMFIIIFFIPAFENDSNFSFIYSEPNISSMYSNNNSIVMNSNCEFVWPTPRI